jgi:thiol-disulfide isomerase/thioredoxin
LSPLPSTPSSTDGRFSRSRLAILLAISIGIPAIALLFILRADDSGGSASPTSSPPTVPAPRRATIGAAAPDFLGHDLQGRTVQLSHLRGAPVILTFFASWCHPCEEELPALEQAQLAAGNKLHVVAVNYQDIADDSRDFAHRLGVTFPVVTEDTAQNPIARRYDVHEMPDVVFIDAKGVVRDREWGPMSKSDIQSAVSRLSSS